MDHFYHRDQVIPIMVTQLALLECQFKHSYPSQYVEGFYVQMFATKIILLRFAH